MTRFTAKVTREGKWWMVHVPEVSGLTQARRLSEAGLMARELVAVTLDIPIEQINVTIEIDSVGYVTDITERLARIEQQRRDATELERQASCGAVELAKSLVEMNVPLRDVGAVLGVSHQRAHQLVNG